MNISYGKTELLKWAALVLMLGDHVNKFLFNGNYSEFLFNAGRLCLPIFVFVLAANLAVLLLVRIPMGAAGYLFF